MATDPGHLSPSTSVGASTSGITLDDILPEIQASVSKPPPPSYTFPVSLINRISDNAAAGKKQGDQAGVSLRAIPVVSSGDVVGVASKGMAGDHGTPVTIHLQHPDGQGEGTVVAAQVAKMIPINLPRDGKSITKVVEIQSAVEAGHTIYQIVVEPISSNMHGAGGAGHGDATNTFMLGQVLQVGQEQESKHHPVPTAVSAAGFVTSHISSANREPTRPLPPNCPPWAARLKHVEEIGDSYRGYVESEVELDLLLTYHKQQTGSYWGTRQSPSNERASKRLMWKSQYVPYDGIPFINSGSRAIVMECQFGPRRKGAAAKKLDNKRGFQVTCPARIYIKKVKKFPQFQVLTDKNADKKQVRQAQDNAFQTIKDLGVDTLDGTERYYVQLPTTKAHEYHDQFPVTSMQQSSYYTKPDNLLDSKPQPAVVVKDIQSSEMLCMDGGETPGHSPGHKQHIHPKVADKITELVSHGMVNAYVIRQNLRNYVMHKLFTPGNAPERHNLQYFPTINNIQNHVYEALKAIEQGELVPVVAVSLADLVNMSTPPTRKIELHQETSQEHAIVLPHSTTSAGGNPQAQMVTVTLTQDPDDVDGSTIISRVETQMTDGTTRICDTISAETAQLLSQLTPKMFTHQNITQVQETSEGTVTIQMQRLTETQAATSELNQSESMLNTDDSSINQPGVLLHSDDPSTSGLGQSGELLEAPDTDHLVQSGGLLESDPSDSHISPTDILLQAATESVDDLHHHHHHHHHHQSDALLEHEHSAIDQSEVMTHHHHHHHHKDDTVLAELASQAEDQASLLLSMHESISLSHNAPEMQDEEHDGGHHDNQSVGGEHDDSLSKRPRLDMEDITDNTLCQ